MSTTTTTIETASKMLEQQLEQQLEEQKNRSELDKDMKYHLEMLQRRRALLQTKDTEAKKESPAHL